MVIINFAMIEQDIINSSDERLIELAQNDKTSTLYLAEFLRRNIKAINRFNRMSTILSIAMILLTIAILSFEYTNRKQISTIDKNKATNNQHTVGNDVK
jgi:uncharacterized membrane protein